MNLTSRRKPRPTWEREFRSSLRRGIERETQLMPWLIADSLLHEAGCWLNTDLPAEWSDWLDARAERCFAGHRQFRRLISSCANGGYAGCDYLYKYMRNWLSGRLARERPALYRLLPQPFTMGVPLPASRAVMALKLAAVVTDQTTR